MSETKAERASLQREVETSIANTLKGQIGRIANGLRRLADAANRAAADVDLVVDGKRASYSNIAATVQHEILWGLANLGLDGLISAAQDADAAKATQATREKIAAAIESTISGYPSNGAERPKVDVGEFANDAQWAARIARQHDER